MEPPLQPITNEPNPPTTPKDSKKEKISKKENKKPIIKKEGCFQTETFHEGENKILKISLDPNRQLHQVFVG